MESVNACAILKKVAFAVGIADQIAEAFSVTSNEFGRAQLQNLLRERVR